MPLDFTRERFGSPQAIALFLLAIFIGQCCWFCFHVPLAGREVEYVLQGQRQWRSLLRVADLDQPSAVTGLAAAFPLIFSHGAQEQVPLYWRWLARAPFMLMGALFGASVWYVSRRLYGNTAGYIALVLYAFSPTAIIQSSIVQPNVIAAWGAFGTVFTAIGLAHTLYAPREVVLWNWKRIILLGVAIGLGCAAQVAVVILVPISLALMWYLAPQRRGAASVIMAAGTVIGAIILFAANGFSLSAVVMYFRAAKLTTIYVQAYTSLFPYLALFRNFFRQPTTLLFLLIALATYLAWKRARFFGTTAPLLVFALLVLLGIAMPQQSLQVFYVLALPFSYVFISGVMTDLLESRQRPVILGVVLGVLFGHVLLSFSGLLRM